MEKLLQPIFTEAAKADVSRAGYCGSNDRACPTGVRLMVLHDAHASSTMASELADLGSTLRQWHRLTLLRQPAACLQDASAESQLLAHKFTWRACSSEGGPAKAECGHWHRHEPSSPQERQKVISVQNIHSALCPETWTPLKRPR